jgi:hypothetical protein
VLAPCEIADSTHPSVEPESDPVSAEGGPASQQSSASAYSRMIAGMCGRIELIEWSPVSCP